MRLGLRLAWLVTFVVVAGGSLLPDSNPALQPVKLINDKMLHLGGYALLALLTFANLPRSSRLAAALLVFGVGLTIELIQPAVGRMFDWKDLLANSLGIAVATALWRVAGAGSP
jgi:VanZ family protein